MLSIVKELERITPYVNATFLPDKKVLGANGENEEKIRAIFNIMNTHKDQIRTTLEEKNKESPISVLISYIQQTLSMTEYTNEQIIFAYRYKNLMDYWNNPKIEAPKL